MCPTLEQASQHPEIVRTHTHTPNTQMMGAPEVLVSLVSGLWAQLVQLILRFQEPGASSFVELGYAWILFT